MDKISVEIAYAEADRQWLIPATLSDGSTVADAIAQSGLEHTLPGLNVDNDHVGVFGQRCRLDQPLRDGDRVEIYRPLLIDPREERRQRVASKREGA